MFKFYLDNILLSESPEGWDKLRPTLRLDKELKGLLPILEGSLTFYDDGYRYIKNIFDTLGRTVTIKFECRQFDDVSAYKTISTGIIFLKDVEFTEGIEAYSAKVEVKDDSYFARIQNNRELNALCYVGASKNGVTIDPAPYYKIQYFNPTTGSGIGIPAGAGSERNNTAFKVYDVLKFYIDFITDGKVDFVSDAFSDSGVYGGYLITTGFFISYATTAGIDQDTFEANWPELTFKEIFKELDLEFNLSFQCGFNGSRPFIRIENNEYLYPEDIQATYSNLPEIKRKIASERFFSKIFVGADETLNDASTIATVGLSYPSGVKFNGWTREEYYLRGEDNNDRVLDLVNTWIVDSNNIEDLLMNGGPSGTAPDSLYNKIFLVKCTFSSGVVWNADQSNWITGAATPVFYNEPLINANKMRRWSTALSNSIIAQLATVDNSFSAHSTQQIDATNNGSIAQVQDLNPVQASVEDSDPSGNFNPATYTYTLPADGTYVFNSVGNWRVFDAFGGSAPSCDVNIDVFLENVTAGFNVQIYSQHDNPSCGSSFTVNASGAIQGLAGDEINLRITFSGSYNVALMVGSNLRMLPGTTFACTASAESGGEYLTVDPDRASVMRHSFKQPIAYDEWQTFQDDPRGLIGHGIKGGKTYYGHLEEIKYNFFGETDFIVTCRETDN